MQQQSSADEPFVTDEVGMEGRGAQEDDHLLSPDQDLVIYYTQALLAKNIYLCDPLLVHAID